MSGRPPVEIWEDGLDEGERRLSRGLVGLAATGFAGGAEVAIGILVVTVMSGALSKVLPEQTAHVLSAGVFGIAFVLITIGRAELFTENFYLPVGAVYVGRAPLRALWRMWGVTLLFNLVGLAVFLGLMSISGVLKAATLHAAGPTADTYATRGALAAFASAIIAGTVMTLFTWVVAAADNASARVIISLLVGFVLVAPSLNHAVVAFGKVLFGMYTGTSVANAGDLFRNLGLAIAGNLVGGIGFVFATRLAQVRGEPDHQATDRAERRPDDDDLPAAAERVAAVS